MKILDILALIIITATISLSALADQQEAGHPQDQDDKASIEKLVSLANTGNAWAQTNLGNLYQRGQGVTLNEAIKWYRLAAEQGNVEAQTNLGRLFSAGLIFPKHYTDAPNYKEAVPWLRVAAEHGIINAQNTLGYMYANGKGGLPKNSIIAHAFYILAAKNGHILAAESSVEQAGGLSGFQIKQAQLLAHAMSKPGNLLVALDKFACTSSPPTSE